MKLNELAPLAAMAGRAVAGAAADKVVDALTDAKEEGEISEDDSVYEAINSMMEKEMAREAYPAQGEYPDGPAFPEVRREAKEELDEDGYPHSIQYPTKDPAWPRVQEADTLKELGGEEEKKGMKEILPQLMSLLTSLEVRDIMKLSTMLPKIANMKQSSLGGAMESKQIKEAPSHQQVSSQNPNQTLQQLLSKIQAQPQMSDQEAEAMGNEIVDLIKMNRQMSDLKQADLPTMKGPQNPFSQERPQPGLEKVNRQVGRMRRDNIPTMRGESKKITITKKKLKEIVAEGIMMHQKKQFVDRVVKEQINEQIKVHRLANHYLNEGPLSSMWQGAKSAGAGLAGAAKGLAQGAKGAMQQAAAGAEQGRAQQQAQNQVQQAQKELMKFVSAANKAKDKFTQETLKSSQLLSNYHDAVSQMVQAYQQLAPQLGAEAERIKDEIDRMKDQLKQDLQSEKEGVESFLKTLGQEGQYKPPTPDQVERSARLQRGDVGGYSSRRGKATADARSQNKK